MITEQAEKILKEGSVKIRVTRNGMFQQLTFNVKRAKLGNIEYPELSTDRVIDVSELSRIANEFGLPVEAANGKAFPDKKSATDFQNY